MMATPPLSREEQLALWLANKKKKKTGSLGGSETTTPASRRHSHSSRKMMKTPASRGTATSGALLKSTSSSERCEKASTGRHHRRLSTSNHRVPLASVSNNNTRPQESIVVVAKPIRRRSGYFTASSRSSSPRPERSLAVTHVAFSQQQQQHNSYLNSTSPLSISWLDDEDEEEEPMLLQVDTTTHKHDESFVSVYETPREFGPSEMTQSKTTVEKRTSTIGETLFTPPERRRSDQVELSAQRDVTTCHQSSLPTTPLLQGTEADDWKEESNMQPSLPDDDELPQLEAALEEFQQPLNWQELDISPDLSRPKRTDRKTIILPIPSLREQNNLKSLTTPRTALPCLPEQTERSGISPNPAQSSAPRQQAEISPHPIDDPAPRTSLQKDTEANDPGEVHPECRTLPDKVPQLEAALEEFQQPLNWQELDISPDPSRPKRTDRKTIIQPIPSLREHNNNEELKASSSTRPSPLTELASLDEHKLSERSTSGISLNPSLPSTQQHTGISPNHPPMDHPVKEASPPPIETPRLELQDDDDEFDWRRGISPPDCPKQAEKRRTSFLLLPYPSLREERRTPTNDSSPKPKHEGDVVINDDEDDCRMPKDEESSNIEELEETLEPLEGARDESEEHGDGISFSGLDTRVQVGIRTLLPSISEQPPLTDQESSPELAALREQMGRLLVEKQNLADRLYAIRRAHDDRVTPFRDTFEDMRKLRTENVSLKKEKQEVEQLVVGMQQQMMTAINMAVEKTKVLQRKLDESNDKLEEANREIAELKKQLSKKGGFSS